MTLALGEEVILVDGEGLRLPIYTRVVIATPHGFLLFLLTKLLGACLAVTGRRGRHHCTVIEQVTCFGKLGLRLSIFGSC